MVVVQLLLRFEDREDDGRAGSGYDRTEADALDHVESQQHPGQDASDHHYRQLYDHDAYREYALLADLAEVDLQPYAEHQHHQAYVRQDVDDFLAIGRDGPHVRDDDPGDDVPDERREPDLVE